MSGENIVFLLLALVALAGAFYSATARRVFHSALALFVVLGAIAGIYLLLDAEFLAVLQLLLYVGGVAVLIVFGIMLTPVHEEEKRGPFVRWSYIAAAGTVLLAASLVYLFWRYRLDWDAAPPGSTPLGPDASGYPRLFAFFSDLLFKDYLVPFELLSLALLAALIGALVTARKREG